MLERHGDALGNSLSHVFCNIFVFINDDGLTKFHIINYLNFWLRSNTVSSEIDKTAVIQV